MAQVETYFAKMRGGEARPPAPKAPIALMAGLGAALAILVVSEFTRLGSAPLLMAPLGASCFLAFAVPGSPLAQPRNIVLGHGISTAVGFAVLYFIGSGGWAMAVAVGLAVFLMLVTRTGHPPAGADPLVVLMLQPGLEFLVFPALAGAVVVAAVAVVFNNLRSGIRYPLYW